MKALKFKSFVMGMVLGAAGVCNGAPVQGDHNTESVMTQWVPVDNDVLADARGGFQMDTGLRVSFGFLRSVSINGELVTSTQFNLPDVSRISAEQASEVSAALTETRLVQVGEGNSVVAAARANLAGATVIQNSLSNQHIQSTTIINTGVNSQSMFKAVNVQSVLNDALLGALTRR